MGRAGVEQLLQLPGAGVRPNRRQPRKVLDLKCAAFTTNPPFSPPRRARGAKLKGLRYERRVGKWLHTQFPADTKIVHGPWIEFEDSNGVGFAQPDYLVYAESALWIIEAKLTHVPEALLQLQGLYSPLCGDICPDSPQVLVEVTRNLGVNVGALRGLLIEELDLARPGTISIKHWIG